MEGETGRAAVRRDGGERALSATTPAARSRWSVRLGAAATAVVALGSGVLSWDAQSWGAGQLGVDAHLTWLYPVVIDGTIVVGTVTALALRRSPYRIRVYVWTMLAGAIAVSVAGNAAHAAAGSVIHMVGSAVPAVALAVSLHLLVILVRHTPGEVPTPAEEGTPASEPAAGRPGPTEPQADDGHSSDQEPVKQAAVERSDDRPPPVEQATGPVTGAMAAEGDLGDRAAAAPAGSANGHDPTLAGVVERTSAGEADGPADGQKVTAAMTAQEARTAAVRLVRRASSSGRTVTTADVQRLTGRKARQARRLLAQATAAITAPGPGAQPPSAMEVER